MINSMVPTLIALLPRLTDPVVVAAASDLYPAEGLPVDMQVVAEHLSAAIRCETYATGQADFAKYNKFRRQRFVFQ